MSPDHFTAPILAQSIQKKLDELKALDARIEKRMDHLARTEQNLRLLFESLRGQIVEAHPLIAQLSELRQGSMDMLDNITDQVRRNLEDSASSANFSPTVASVAIDASAAEAQVANAVAIGIESIDARARRLGEDVHNTIESARQYLDGAFDSARHSAQATLEALQTKLEELRSVSNDIMNVGEHLPMQDKSDQAEAALDEAVSTFGQQADATIEAIRRSVSQQIEQLAAGAKLEIKPVLSKIEEGRKSAEAQIAAAADSAEAALAARVETLRRNAERMVELAERQIIDRLSTIKPRTRATLDSIEHAAAQRMSQAMDELASAMTRTEQRLMERIDGLRPRAADAAMAIEKDLIEQVKRMEEDAVAGVHWLEHRLARRVEEIAERMKKAVDDRIEEADETLDGSGVGVSAAPNSRKMALRPPSPVEVQVMVDTIPTVVAREVA